MIAFITTLAFQRVMNVPVLLLDEVDAALDAINSEKVAKVIKEVLGGI